MTWTKRWQRISDEMNCCACSCWWCCGEVKPCSKDNENAPNTCKLEGSLEIGHVNTNIFCFAERGVVEVSKICSRT
jgi:hypothetical protein